MPDDLHAERSQAQVDYQLQVERLLASRRGHFLLESGHHGELWLDLELLCLDPHRIQPLAIELADRLRGLDVDVVCGPLNEGAFVALMVALRSDVDFIYSEPRVEQRQPTLYPVAYRIPGAVRNIVRGRRVAIVNDVINAGSAVGGTFADLEACGASIVAIASLMVLGNWTTEFAAKRGVAVYTLASLPNQVWTPEDCPLCERHVPLDNAPPTR